VEQRILLYYCIIICMTMNNQQRDTEASIFPLATLFLHPFSLLFSLLVSFFTLTPFTLFDISTVWDDSINSNSYQLDPILNADSIEAAIGTGIVALFHFSRLVALIRYLTSSARLLITNWGDIYW
jgi:hypothetical protein